MATDLSAFVDSLKREVTPLGSTEFSTITDPVWTAYLTDAFWEARLDGLMEGYSETGNMVSLDADGSDLPRQWIALIVLYAGIRVLRNRILNSSANDKLRAKAGPVEFERESGSSATVLAELLKQLRMTKDRILEELDEETSVLYLDAFSTRLFSFEGSYWGSPELSGGY
jgi:hypothetical protein